MEKKRFSFQSCVTGKVKMVFLYFLVLCLLPLSHASGAFDEQKEDGGTADACRREEKGHCFNEGVALKLKIGAVFAIFLSSLLGVSLPLVGSYWSLLKSEGNLLFVAKAFGAGVILGTGFIHMLPEATEKLDNVCLPDFPWHKFPWSSFFAMLTILLMTLIEFTLIRFSEMQANKGVAKVVASGLTDSAPPSDTADDVERNIPAGNLVCHHGPGLSPSGLDGSSLEIPLLGQQHYMSERQHVHFHGGHFHGVPSLAEDGLKVRRVVVAQVLEFGIASHSILIGLAIGVSFSPCDIRPLLGALAFHQFFEGVALGGCITQAAFRSASSISMAFIFATTTPLGIGIGIGISSSYNANSVTALLVEGILDSISGGILIYMALVNLIASEFFGERLRQDRRLQALAFTALFLGAAALSIIGVWA